MTVKPKQRYIISLFIVLMVSAIVILDLSLLADQEEARIEESITPTVNPLPFEAGVFARADLAQKFENMPADAAHQRVLKKYYEDRAFAGAPPIIPHAILNENTLGGKSCLQCHQNGGFVEQFNAFAPVTPHPEMLNCRQCHVPAKTKALFVNTEFTRLAAPEIGGAALPGSPPVIPHGLQMRENCLACHAGPAAPKEIRVSHPERINCRQCHAAKPLQPVEWVRLKPDTEE
jgi:nitrate reductase (cytochrome), electron transfer subunit